MATVYWRGGKAGSEGDWDYDNTPTFAGSNWWDAQFGGSEAAKPVNGDTVIFNTGSQDVDDGLNQSAVGLEKLRIWPGYTGAIAASGGHLLIDIDNTTDAVLDMRGSTGVWITGTIKFAYIKAPLPTTTVAISNSGTMGDVRVSQGTVSIDGGTITKLWTTLVNSNTDATVTTTSGTTIGTLTAFGGNTTIASKPDYVYGYGGLVTQTAGDWPERLYWATGTYLYSSSNAGGTMIAYVFDTGVIDARGSTGIFAISASSIVHPRGTIDIRNGSMGITGDVQVYGGRYLTDVGDVVELRSRSY